MTYCAQCGQPASKQADNLFVCPEGHQNWINAIPGATVFILNEKGQVLYGVRSIEPHKGSVELPGGILDLNESAEQAARREVKEELGVDVRLLDFLGSYADDYAGRPALNIAFVAKYSGGEIKPGDDLSGGEPTWRNMDDLPTRDEVGWAWYATAQKDLRAWWQKNKGRI